MSVFLEPNFVNFINKLAQQATPEISKLNLDISKSLLEDLKSKLSSEKSFVSSKTDSEIYLQDVESTDSFIKFLWSDQISFNGVRLCVTKQNPLVSEEELQKYSKYPTPTDDKKENFSYYIRKDLIIEFIRQLMANGNAIIRTALSKINFDINEIQADPAKKETEEFLSPDTLMDWWYTSKTIDLTNPLNGIEKPSNLPDGMVVLKKKDLDSVDALQNWIKNHTIKINTTISGGPGFNVCNLLQSLYKRAVARNQASTTATKFYVSQIQTIGPAFKGPDNKDCQIMSATDQKIITTDPTEGVAGYTKELTPKQQEDLGKAFNESIDLLSQLTQSNVLDIDVIRNIVRSVNKVFNLRKVQSVSSITQSVEAIIGPKLVDPIVQFTGQSSITMEQSQFEQFSSGGYQTAQKGFYGKFIYNLSLFIRSLIAILNVYQYHFRAISGLDVAIKGALETLKTWDRNVSSWGRMYAGSSK